MKTLHYSIITVLILVSFFATSANTVFAQTPQYDFKIWPADSWKAPGHLETIDGIICPTPKPDMGTNSSLTVYFTLPPWVATQAGTPYFVTHDNMIPSCTSQSITTIRPNFTGTYPVYATAQWTENGKIQTVQSNSTQFLAMEPCTAAYVMIQDKLKYHPEDVIPIKISSRVLGCKHLPVTIQITVYNYTGNTRSNILYQESRQIINQTWFNYTVPKWTDNNGIFPFIISTTWPDRNITGESFLQFLSSDNTKIPKSYNFTMWVNPSSFTNDGSGTVINWKACPFSPPTDDNRQETRDPSTGLIVDSGPYILVEHHFTLPNGTTKIQQNEMEPLADCNTYVFGTQVPANTIGAWSVYNTFKWVWKNSTHELSTKPVNFTVTPALYANKKLEEIDIKNIFSELDANGSSYQNINLQDWSRDGNLILFNYNGYDPSSSSVQLGTMTPDGKEVRRLPIPMNFASIYQARFSPNNVVLILGYPTLDAAQQLYKFSINDQKLVQLTNYTMNEPINSFAVSPDGNIVYGQEIYSGNDYLGFDIWLVNPDGKKITKLYEKLFDPKVRYSQDYDGRDHFLVRDVSYDGKKILVYSAYSTGMFEIHSSIGLFDIENKRFDTLFGSYGENYRISPAGDLIVYVTPTGDKTPGGPLQIVSTDNSYHETLHTGESALGEYPTSFVISPDGRFIISKIQPWSTSDQKLFRAELIQAIPEFPFAILILLISISSTIIFYRMKFRK